MQMMQCDVQIADILKCHRGDPSAVRVLVILCRINNFVP